MNKNVFFHPTLFFLMICSKNPISEQWRWMYAVAQSPLKLRIPLNFTGLCIRLLVNCFHKQEKAFKSLWYLAELYFPYLDALCCWPVPLPAAVVTIKKSSTVISCCNYKDNLGLMIIFPYLPMENLREKKIIERVYLKSVLLNWSI